MSLLLVIHHPAAPPGTEEAAACQAALRDAVWEVAESHWMAGAEALLVASDLSPRYLVTHFRARLAQRGFTDPGMILVAPFGEDAVRFGLPPEAAAWIEAEG